MARSWQILSIFRPTLTISARFICIAVREWHTLVFSSTVQLYSVSKMGRRPRRSVVLSSVHRTFGVETLRLGISSNNCISTVVMLLLLLLLTVITTSSSAKQTPPWEGQFIPSYTLLIIISIPSPPHSCIPVLKPPFSANPSHRSLPFLLQDWLHGFPGLFTDTSEHILFFFLIFLVFHF